VGGDQLEAQERGLVRAQELQGQVGREALGLVVTVVQFAGDRPLASLEFRVLEAEIRIHEGPHPVHEPAPVQVAAYPADLQARAGPILGAEAGLGVGKAGHQHEQEQNDKITNTCRHGYPPQYGVVARKSVAS